MIMQNHFHTSLLTLFIIVTVTLFGSVENAFAKSSVAHEEDHSEHAGEEDHVKIETEIASKAGIKSEIARSGLIKQIITVYGRTVVDPSKVSHIHARFPGMITKIQVDIGDSVKAGEVLVEIESNESLKRYTLTSPLTGVITTRNGNPGELAQEQTLLTVANYDKMWVEFRIFPSQAHQILVGQSVTSSSNLLQSESVIKHLLPNNIGQPFTLARVLLNNTNGQWTPGLLLEGKIVIKKIRVPLAIDNRALQSIQGSKVVFVQVGNNYEIRKLELGLSDGKFTEVINGLNVGDQYVVENSYFIKADLEKSGASHDH